MQRRSGLSKQIAVSIKNISMPLKRIGPPTRQEANKKASQAQLEDAKLQHAVKVAVQEGAQPTTFNRTQGRFFYMLQVGA